jgi:hypothetical protein
LTEFRWSRGHLDTAFERNLIGARLCVQSTSRSTLKSAALGIFKQAGFAKLLRLVFDTAALRDSARMRLMEPPHVGCYKVHREQAFNK